MVLIHSKKTKKKLSETLKRLFREGKIKPTKYWLGKQLSKQHCKNISKALKGRKGNPTLEKTKRKISQTLKKGWKEGRIKPARYWLNKRNIKQSRTRKKLFKEGKLKSWNKGKTKENYPQLSHKRSKEAIKKMKKTLRDRGLCWTNKEIEFLKNNYKKMLYKDIAKRLGRTCNSINRECSLLKLKSGRGRFVKGHKKGMYGKHHSKETKLKIGLIHKGKKPPKSAFKKGDKPWNNGLTKETDERLKLSSKKAKKRFKDKNFLKKWSKSIGFKPNKPEKFLIRLFKQLNLPYKYIGDGSFWITGFNPDFINCNGQKKIIELFGDYWHNKEDNKERDKDRLEIYKKYGYKTLIIWEHELENINQVINKIEEFNKL